MKTLGTTFFVAPIALAWLVACGGANNGASASHAEGSRFTRKVEGDLFSMLSDYRVKIGLRSLKRHEGIDQVARDHSADMVRVGYRAHRSKSGTMPPDRVQAAGFQSGLILENIGEGPSAVDIHQGLITSPGHRANIINPDVSHVGVGVVPVDSSPGANWVATQVFVSMAEEIDTKSAPAYVLDRINQARVARGVGPLESDPNLRTEAQKGAQNYFSDQKLSQQDVVSEASAGLRRFSIQFARVGGVMAVVTNLDDAVHLEPTFDRGLRYVGIGVAQGTRPDSPSNAIAVVIMFAWPR